MHITVEVLVKLREEAMVQGIVSNKIRVEGGKEEEEEEEEEQEEEEVEEVDETVVEEEPEKGTANQEEETGVVIGKETGVALQETMRTSLFLRARILKRNTTRVRVKYTHTNRAILNGDTRIVKGNWT